MRGTLLVLAALAVGTSAVDAGQFVKATGARAIPGCYVVVLEPGAAARAGGPRAGMTASQLAVGAAARFGGKLGHVFEHALSGYSICLPEAAA